MKILPREAFIQNWFSLIWTSKMRVMHALYNTDCKGVPDQK